MTLVVENGGRMTRASVMAEVIGERRCNQRIKMVTELLKMKTNGNLGGPTVTPRGDDHAVATKLHVTGRAMRPRSGKSSKRTRHKKGRVRTSLGFVTIAEREPSGLARGQHA